MTGVYCVFCRTGFEAGIESRLKRRGYATLVPKIKKFKPSGGKLVEKELLIFSTYLFMNFKNRLPNKFIGVGKSLHAY